MMIYEPIPDFYQLYINEYMIFEARTPTLVELNNSSNFMEGGSYAVTRKKDSHPGR